MIFPLEVKKLFLYAGDDVDVTFTLTRENSEEPIDLSEWENWEAVWNSAGVDIPLDVNPNNSSIVLSFSKEATRKTEGRQGVYDVQATKNGTTRTWLRGMTYTEEDITP